MIFHVIISSLFARYLEIVHPIWHKTHFKKKWLYVSFAIIWPFGMALYAGFWLPSTEVSLQNPYQSVKIDHLVIY